MSDAEARIALAKLIESRMAELGVERAGFMRRTGFTQESTFTCYLRGFSNLQLWQVPSVAKILQLNERDILLMCLRQSYDDWVMELFQRHIRPRRRRKR
ncbi:hypothetical protein [Sinorhizobium fredii]|uniref:hypothetical protein n=1 Tax=Rhizobium fredii TaxID=380 RepID=UPI0004AF42DA|nr:hypothetical protein [Sinorhizobium fredii]